MKEVKDEIITHENFCSVIYFNKIILFRNAMNDDEYRKKRLSESKKRALEAAHNLDW